MALLILEKLVLNNIWGGKEKGYMWSTDIPKGRGVDEKYAHRTPHVLNLLLQHDLLIKKASQGKSKYALNSHLRTDINAILRDRKLPEDLNRLL
ncbi:hypothetical protein V2K57_15810 [Pseudomonas alliivorans]|nr:hypothetical protein [Pseudomonas alliivorans]MEE4701980.1 hypothetical protein [Pseudomonas alliivorans]MEE4737841.1 hypothetical protein [Pseudomonas alliivorans]